MNTPKIHELWNTQTEQVEGENRLTPEQAKERNAHLIAMGEPQRWIKKLPIEET